MPTLTPRAGYTLDPTGQIGVQHDNWDKADAFAGVIYTTAAAGIPPTAQLFDNCIVVEKDTGISYRLTAATGYAVKKYINYPFQYTAYTVMGYGSGSPGAWGWLNVDTARCVNFTSAWKDGPTSGMRVQVKGLYSISGHVHAIPQSGQPAISTGNFTLGIYKNGVHSGSEDVNTLVRSGWASPSITCNHTFMKALNVNDLIQPYFYNNMGTVVDLTIAIEATLVRPL